MPHRSDVAIPTVGLHHFSVLLGGADAHRKKPLKVSSSWWSSPMCSSSQGVSRTANVNIIPKDTCHYLFLIIFSFCFDPLIVWGISSCCHDAYWMISYARFFFQSVLLWGTVSQFLYVCSVESLWWLLLPSIKRQLCLWTGFRTVSRNSTQPKPYCCKSGTPAQILFSKNNEHLFFISVHLFQHQLMDMIQVLHWLMANKRHYSTLF